MYESTILYPYDGLCVHLIKLDDQYWLPTEYESLDFYGEAQWAWIEEQLQAESQCQVKMIAQGGCFVSADPDYLEGGSTCLVTSNVVSLNLII